MTQNELSQLIDQAINKAIQPYLQVQRKYTGGGGFNPFASAPVATPKDNHFHPMERRENVQ